MINDNSYAYAGRGARRELWLPALRTSRFLSGLSFLNLGVLLFAPSAQSFSCATSGPPGLCVLPIKFQVAFNHWRILLGKVLSSLIDETPLALAPCLLRRFLPVYVKVRCWCRI